MRKFKFIGDPSRYEGESLKKEVIYNSDYKHKSWNSNVGFYALHRISYIDWQEVFEEPALQDRIQELKDFAKGQGLKVDVVVDDIDIWEGVEFAESLHNLDCGDGKFTKRKIYPINNIGKKTLTFKFDDNCNPINASSKSFFKPSTESAYVEQLKKEAFELFGEIKDGDRFELPSSEIYKISNINFSYDKSVDFFRINGVAIYQSGKWAKKLPKRVEVDPNSLDSISKAFNKCSYSDSNKFKVFLAKQLEKYLNGEVE